jgi:hypothetical protein
MSILCRDLSYTKEDGPVLSVPVRIHAPETDGVDWSCLSTIGWPHGVESFRTHGFDAVQALFLALQSTGARIYGSEYHETGRLSFDGHGRGYGFPVPKIIRDLLVGDDKRFLG